MASDERFGPEGISRWDRETESWVTFDPLPRRPEHRCAPAGLCIYCGVTTYTNEGGALREEHIVPLAINGNYVFPEASCRECEQITGRNEAAIMRGGFRAVREYLQLRSRTKKRPSELPLFNVNRVDGIGWDGKNRNSPVAFRNAHRVPYLAFDAAGFRYP